MDKIHLLEMINRYDGQSVHIYTKDGKFLIGQLNVVSHADFRRHLEIGWRQDRVEVANVFELHPV